MHKCTEIEIQTRVDVVFDLLLSGASRKDILQYSTKEAKWDVAPRTLDDYIKKATARFEALAEPDRKAAFGRALARREDLYKRNKKVQDFKAALAVEQDTAKLLGFYAAERHEISGPNGAPIPVAWPNLRAVILQALAPYPDARAAVAAALISLENANNGPGPGPRPCARPAEVDAPGEASA